MMYSSSSVMSRENALFTVDDGVTHHHYASFGVMKMFASLYKLGTAVDTGDDHRKELYALAAVSADDGALMLSVRNYEGKLELALNNCPFNTCTLQKLAPGGVRGKGSTFRSGEVDIRSGRLALSVGKGEVYSVNFYNK